MVPGLASATSDHAAIYATITEAFGDGTNNGVGNFANGTGPIVFNIKVPAGAIVDIVYPVFKNAFTPFFTLVMFVFYFKLN